MCLARRPGDGAVPPAHAADDVPDPEVLSPTRRIVGWIVAVGLILASVALIPLEGVGLLVLLVLTPALIRLFRTVPSGMRGRPATAGEIALGVVAGICLLGLVAVSAVVLFVAVCLPLGAIGFASSYGMSGSWGFSLIILAFVLGALAAGGVVYVIVRGFFPPR
jgi:hypothetical protein